VRLSTFGSVFVNKKNLVTQVDGSWCELPGLEGVSSRVCVSGADA